MVLSELLIRLSTGLPLPEHGCPHVIQHGKLIEAKDAFNVNRACLDNDPMIRPTMEGNICLSLKRVTDFTLHLDPLASYDLS